VKLRPITLAIISTLVSTTVYAEQLETITVNADFRPAEIQETTSSVTVITPVEIQKRSAQHLENILNLAPNVNSAGGASRTNHFQIRGIGERGEFENPINPSVGLTVDGIDYSRSGAAGTLFDVKQVEVLRGPQGTQFGASAMAGMINIESNEPTNHTEAHIEQTIGNMNTKSTGIALGGALIKDKLLGRVSIHKHTSDGYMENTYLNRDDTQNQDEVTAKAQLKWLATDSLTFDLNLVHIDIDNGYDAYSFDNDYTTTTDEPGKDTLKSDAFALKTTWDISSKVRMETTLTHSESDLEYSYDDDWTYDGQYDNGYSAVDQYLRDRTNSSIDMRFLSSEKGRIFNGSTDWVAGIYHLNQDDKLEREYPYRYPYIDPIFNSSYKTRNSALYGQLDHHLSAKTILTTGLRVESFEFDYKDSENISSSNSELLYGGKIGLSHQYNKDHLSFITLSRGYKAGGVNSDSRIPAENLTFDTEYLWNLETGLNSSFLNNDLKTRIAVFYTQRNDQQVNTSIQEDGSSDFVTYYTNAAKSEHFGLETELDWNINDKWRLKSSLGLLHATFIDFDYIDKDSGEIVVLDGKEQAHAPSYQYSIGAEYAFSDNWIASANIEGKDAFNFSNSHEAESTAYNLVNASLEYMESNWTITLWARNLTDTEYDVRGYYFGIDPSLEYDSSNNADNYGPGYDAGTYTQKGAPRTVGLTVAWDY